MGKKKEKKNYTRDKPQQRSTESFLCTMEAYETLCAGEYTRLSDNPEIKAAVNKIADLVSSMTIHLMENTEKGDIRVKDELAKKIDINPNPYMTRKTFLSVIVRTLLLEGDGNCFVYPRTKNGLLEELVPLPPGNVSCVPDGYGYQILYNGIAYSPENMLHFVMNPRADYPWMGEGYRVNLKDVANNLRQAAKTKKGFMESKWKPSLIVKVDSTADEFSTPEGRRELRKQYLDTSEAGEPWMLPAEIFDVHEIKPLSLQDLAINDAVMLDKKTVAAILDVPPFIVGAGEYNKDVWDNFISTKIKTFCNGIEQELTKKLLISPRRYFRFNARSLYSYDIEKLSNVGCNLYTRGLMEGNEVREWIDMPPKEGLDKLVILENYIPQGMIGDQKKLIQNGGGEDGS